MQTELFMSCISQCIRQKIKNSRHLSKCFPKYFGVCDIHSITTIDHGTICLMPEFIAFVSCHGDHHNEGKNSRDIYLHSWEDVPGEETSRMEET